MLIWYGNRPQRWSSSFAGGTGGSTVAAATESAATADTVSGVGASAAPAAAAKKGKAAAVSAAAAADAPKDTMEGFRSLLAPSDRPRYSYMPAAPSSAAAGPSAVSELMQASRKVRVWENMGVHLCA